MAVGQILGHDIAEGLSMHVLETFLVIVQSIPFSVFKKVGYDSVDLKISRMLNNE